NSDAHQRGTRTTKPSSFRARGIWRTCKCTANARQTRRHARLPGCAESVASQHAHSVGCDQDEKAATLVERPCGSQRRWRFCSARARRSDPASSDTSRRAWAVAMKRTRRKAATSMARKTPKTASSLIVDRVVDARGQAVIRDSKNYTM